MMPILYRADETEFDTYGIGMLSDCTFCEVTEERNGAFECVMKYPLHGALFDEIKNDTVILVKPNDTSRSQPFRIYRITTPMNGIITVHSICHMICRALVCCALRANRFHHSLHSRGFFQAPHHSTALIAKPTFLHLGHFQSTGR